MDRCDVYGPETTAIGLARAIRCVLLQLPRLEVRALSNINQFSASHGHISEARGSMSSIRAVDVVFMQDAPRLTGKGPKLPKILVKPFTSSSLDLLLRKANLRKSYCLASAATKQRRGNGHNLEGLRLPPQALEGKCALRSFPNREARKTLAVILWLVAR